jgi:E3 ubiquitin-protein ligase HECTD2
MLDGLPAEFRSFGRSASKNVVNSDDSETDSYGFVHKRKKSEPVPVGHARVPSQDVKHKPVQCPTCNEGCPVKDTSDLLLCPTCDTKIFPPSSDVLDKRPLPPIPVQQPMLLKEFENMMVDMYRQYGRIVFQQEGSRQDSQRNPLPRSSSGNRLELPGSYNGRARAGSDSSGLPMAAGQNRSPPRSRTPNGHLVDQMPLPNNTMLRPSRPPNLVFRDRSATSYGPPPPLPSPRTPRTPLSDLQWRRHMERELEQAKFRPAQIERLVEASALVVPIKDKLRAIFGSSNCLNQTFCSTRRPVMASRSKSANALESPRRENTHNAKPHELPGQQPLPPLPLTPDQLFRDHKALMVGEVYDVVRPLADNSDQIVRSRPSQSERDRRSASAYTDWDALRHWYRSILNYFMDTDRCLKIVCEANQNFQPVDAGTIRDEIKWIGVDMMKTFLEQIDLVVMAPRHAPPTVHELRYLLILLVNPIFGPKQSNLAEAEYRRRDRIRTMDSQLYQSKQGLDRHTGSDDPYNWRKDVETPRQRLLGIILGRLGNAPRQQQHALIHWFAEIPGKDFKPLVETLKRFISERLRLMKPSSNDERNVYGLQLHIYNGREPTNVPRYSRSRSMWQLRAACEVLQMLFTANEKHVEEPEWWERVGEKTVRHPAVRNRLLPLDEFSFSLLDPSAGRIDVEADFRAWTYKSAKFTFCQYRFMLTLGTKVKIMEMYCNQKRREMAWQDVWNSNTASDRDGYFRINVRRDCVADDSLKQLREAIGSGSGETMKKLRVMFEDEMAIDSGGPQKEWFLSLAQDLFHGDHGTFSFLPVQND